MPVQRIPLVGSLLNRNTNTGSFADYDQRFENCYPEVSRNAVTGAGLVNLYKRPGFSATSSAAASYVGVPGAVAAWNRTSPTNAIAWINGTTLGIYDGSDTIIGATISNISGSVRINETLISGDSYLTVVATKSTDSLPHAWFLKEGDASFTEITDGDFPSNQATPLTPVGNMVHLDGYAFIMDSRGNIWNSDLNSLTNWSATGYINAGIYPDGGVGLARVGPLIMAAGVRSIEFFQNGSNATGSPLVRIPSAAKRIGVLNSLLNGCETIKNIGTDVYFVGRDAETNARSIQKITGTEITKISTPAIDKYLMGLGNQVGIAGGITLHGMRHVVLYNGSSTTYAYCVDTGVWWALTMASSLVPCSVIGAGFNANIITTNNRNRYVHNPASPVYQDDGVDYTMSVQLAATDYGEKKRKFFKSLEIIGDTRTTSGNTSISYSDDDFATFSSARNVDMSTARPRLLRLGSARKRAWLVEDSVNAPFRAQALEIYYDIGSQ